MIIRAFDFSKVFLILFFFLGFLLITTDGMTSINLQAVSLAAGCGLGLAFVFVAFDWLSRHFSLRALNVFILGSLLGYLFSLTFIGALSQLTQWSPTLLPDTKWISGIKFSLLMFGIYFGISLVSKASDELYMSIPLVRFRFHRNRKRDLLIDKSVLYDMRVLDLAGSGMLDHRMVIPRHVIRELQDDTTSQDETRRTRARRALDLISSLEMLPQLHLRIYETDFPEVPKSQDKLIKIARSVDADILISSTDPSSLTQIEEIRFINFHAVVSAMQPSLAVGDVITLKVSQIIQDRHGVGFLDDGTKVIIMEAAKYLGQTIKCKVRSIARSLHHRQLEATLEL